MTELHSNVTAFNRRRRVVAERARAEAAAKAKRNKKPKPKPAVDTTKAKKDE